MKSPAQRALCSSLIWGSGQFFNRQYLKALVFFAIQLFAVLRELTSGYYLQYFSGALEGPFVWRYYAGFFGRGLWGLITLGTQPRVIGDSGVIEGDHSVILMIQGVFTLVVLGLLLLAYYLNIKDAYLVAKKQQAGEAAASGLSRAQIAKYIEKQYPYVVSLPALIGVTIFIVIPILFSFLVAFTNYNIFNIPPTKLVDWVGMRNFLDIFRIPIWSSTFSGVLAWNFSFAITLTLGTAFIGLIQALIINHKYVLFPKLWRSVLILPWAMPGLISLLIFRIIFNGQFGPLNDYLLELGLISQRIPWFSDPSYARGMIFAVSFWLGFPYWMVLCSGVLSGIDRSINEAALIDGANDFQVLWYITMPQLVRAIAPLLIFTFAANFNNFGLIYFLTDGGPANSSYQFAGSTDILISWIYKLTVDQRMYNMASVMSILIFLFIAPIAAYNLTRTKAFQEGDNI